MDRRTGLRSPTSDKALRAREPAAPESRPTFRDGGQDSPRSEYHTPLASPTGQEFPGQAAHINPSFPTRALPPSRPPRPFDLSPLGSSNAQHLPLSMRTTARSHEAINTNRHEHTYADISEDSRQPLQAGSSSASSRNPQLAPPLSPRPAGSSPFLSRTLISPILEETSEPNPRARQSVASSKVVPSSWGSHPDDYNFDRVKEKFEDGQEVHQSPTSPESTASMHDDTAGLVRQASLGKRMKPSMTRISSTSDSRSAGKYRAGRGDGRSANLAPARAFPGRNRSQHTQTATYTRAPEVHANRTLAAGNSSPSTRASSSGSGKVSPYSEEPISRSRSPLASATDRSAQQSRAPVSDTDPPGSNVSSLSDKAAARRRPPRLDMQAVRESEVRGSATSLPDLIRRATRLAANLDRSRSASRTGMLDSMEPEQKQQNRRSGSISDILASFPPPSRGAPEGRRLDSRWPVTHFPSKMNQEVSSIPPHETNNAPRRPRGRRCCGMPLYALVILSLFLATLAIVAVIVPVVLVVLPRQRQAAASASLPADVTDCSNSISCQNGGVGVSDGDTCRCICVDGFTGDRCQQVPGPGCASVDVDQGSERLDRATVGKAVADLLRSSTADYGIEFRTAVLLSLFSANNLSCTSQNSLVKIRSQTLRRHAGPPLGHRISLIPSASATISTPTPTTYSTPLPRLQPRGEATSNGIVFATSPTAGVSADLTAGSVSQVSESGSTSPALSVSSRGQPTPETIDFARLAILYVFQRTARIDLAVDAQDSIRNFVFDIPRSADSLSFVAGGVDLSLDFANYSIILGDGTELGGRGDGEGGIRGE